MLTLSALEILMLNLIILSDVFQILQRQYKNKGRIHSNFYEKSNISQPRPVITLGSFNLLILSLQMHSNKIGAYFYITIK